MARQLFREESMEKISRPEELKDYIHVTTPGMVVGIVATVIVCAGILVWAIFGNIPLTMEIRGIAKDGRFTGYSTDVNNLAVGMEIMVGSNSGTITAISEKPISSETIEKNYEDYEAYALALDAFEYEIQTDIETEGAGVLNATVVISRTRPINYIFE